MKFALHLSEFRGKGRRSASEYSSCGSIAMTNLSPLVNTRGPIFTHPEGIVLRPVYHVCDLYRSQPAGEVLDAYVRMPSFEAEITSERIGPLPWGDAVATLDRPAGTLASPWPACIRRSRSSASSGSRAGPGRRSTLTGASPEAFNDISHPDDVSISRTSVAATG